MHVLDIDFQIFLKIEIFSICDHHLKQNYNFDYNVRFDVKLLSVY